METEKKSHWENVYVNKQAHEVSWTQNRPETSLQFIEDLNLPKSAKIIDIGGGDSKLADYLLQEGYESISVLDISEKALERAKYRLGHLANKVKWIHSDVTEFKPSEEYDLWHDRATFHFLTKNTDIESYLSLIKNHVKSHMIVGTFSDKGPDKCSGLEIKKYSSKELSDRFTDNFSTLKCINEDHVTPFETIQNFTFCSFKRTSILY